MNEIDWKRILLDKSSTEYDPELYELLMEEKKEQNLISREELIDYYYRNCLFGLESVYKNYSYVYNEKDDLLTIVNINNDIYKIVICIPYAFDIVDISKANFCAKYIQFIDFGNIKQLKDSYVLSNLPFLKYLVANNLHEFYIDMESFNKKSLIRVYLNSAITISHNLFINSSMLKYVEVQSLYMIDDFLFSMCPSLEYVVISKKIKYIAPVAFSYNYNTSIVYHGSIKDWKKVDKPINYLSGLSVDSLNIIVTK